MAKLLSPLRRRYSDEFKVGAVKLAMRRDVQVQDVAATLGIHPFMLSRWKREYREGRLTGAPARLPVSTVREQNRLRRLERQVAALRTEIELLRKANRLVLSRRGGPAD
jgi:transposase